MLHLGFALGLRWFNFWFYDAVSGRHCCVVHDKAYWLGGTQAQRKMADEALQTCVKQQSTAAMANYMYFMVRWAGHPDWLTLYRWGYGWNYFEKGAPRGYKAATTEEEQQINALLPQAEKIIADDFVSHPVKK